jgi:hypothetical protein
MSEAGKNYFGSSKCGSEKVRRMCIKNFVAEE